MNDFQKLHGARTRRYIAVIDTGQADACDLSISEMSVEACCPRLARDDMTSFLFLEDASLRKNKRSVLHHEYK